VRLAAQVPAIKDECIRIREQHSVLLNDADTLTTKTTTALQEAASAADVSRDAAARVSDAARQIDELQRKVDDLARHWFKELKAKVPGKWGPRKNFHPEDRSTTAPSCALRCVCHRTQRRGEGNAGIHGTRA
jgi:hypothetical protein